ncbi:ABC transporter ATP-binding protein, partial [Azoarcus sp. TTM-91]|nr:ABC transporter ATP-binding protein [Azoarcus sp. TTM-91]
MSNQQGSQSNPSNQPASKVLEVQDLCVSYGKVEALTNANLVVGEGQ